MELFKNRKFRLESEGPYYRLYATENFGWVKAGDKGGLVSGRHNLSELGDCWVHLNAMALDDCKIMDNAQIKGHAKVYGRAEVYGNATVADAAHVYDEARVTGDTTICRDARVFGEAYVRGEAVITDFARLSGKAEVCGDFHFGDRMKKDSGLFNTDTRVSREATEFNSRLRQL